MTAPAVEKANWIKRVLGVAVAEDPRPDDPGGLLLRWSKARDAWQAADEAVGKQISSLATVLRGSGDPDLAKVAESGLMTVTAGYKTKMMAALMDIGTEDAARLRKHAAKTTAFVEKLHAQIENDPKVVACDEADFGVPVTIRATLGKALDGLSDVLAEAAGTP